MKKIFLALFVGLLFLNSCSKDDIKNNNNEKPLTIKNRELEILVGESVNIEAISSNNITYTSEEPLIAKVDEKGKVKARYAGETTIKVSDGKSSINVKVIAIPKHKLFIEPDFTSTKEQYEQKHKKDITKIQQSGDLVAYFLKSGNEKYEYYYTFNDTYRNIIILGIPITSISYSAKSIVDWLSERYILIEKKDDKYNYISPDKKIVVIVEFINNGMKIEFIKEK